MHIHIQNVDDAAASFNHIKLYLSMYGYVHSVFFRHSSSERERKEKRTIFHFLEFEMSFRV